MESLSRLIGGILQDVHSDWPFFVYMILCNWFSVRFLQERRKDREELFQIASALTQRLDRIETAIEEGRTRTANAGSYR